MHRNATPIIQIPQLAVTQTNSAVTHWVLLIPETLSQTPTNSWRAYSFPAYLTCALSNKHKCLLPDAPMSHKGAVSIWRFAGFKLDRGSKQRGLVCLCPSHNRARCLLRGSLRGRRFRCAIKGKRPLFELSRNAARLPALAGIANPARLEAHNLPVSLRIADINVRVAIAAGNIVVRHRAAHFGA